MVNDGYQRLCWQMFEDIEPDDLEARRLLIGKVADCVHDGKADIVEKVMPQDWDIDELSSETHYRGATLIRYKDKPFLYLYPAAEVKFEEVGDGMRVHGRQQYTVLLDTSPGCDGSAELRCVETVDRLICGK